MRRASSRVISHCSWSGRGGRLMSLGSRKGGEAEWPMVRCHGLNCSSNELIEAHIIPAGFARLVTGPGPNVVMRMDRIRQANPQLGEYDPAILCAQCDGQLGVFDDYVVEVCKSFSAKARRVDGTRLFEIPGFDGDKFAKGILAILWRASISKRRTFARVSRGPHETVARDVLFGAKPPSAFRQFELLVARYENRKHWGLYTVPVRNKQPLNLYAFSLCGFSIIAKIDNRRFPRGVRPCIVNGSDALRGIYADFNETPEARAIVDMMQAHIYRGDRKVI
jgi:hypothetical protein